MALSYAVHVAPAAGYVATSEAELPPGQTQRTWSPISSTLVWGEREAVLVDPVLTIEQARGLADWIAATGKDLTTVYVTHGHGDHWFGLSVIRDRFPGVRAVATPAVVGYMRDQLEPGRLDGFWRKRFPDQIADNDVVAEPLDGDTFTLEDEQLIAVELGHTDTEHTTCLHVPSIGLVVAGDAVYNDVHQYVTESDATGRRDWIAAVDVIESLQPKAVVAGHKRAERPDDPRILEETRQYVRDFDELEARTESARELYEQMLARYPDRINPGVLWSSALAQKKG